MPPFTPAELTRNIIKKRHKITDSDEAKKISLFLFDLAIKNKGAAEAFLEINHRFLSVLASIVSKEKLLEFSRANSQELVDNLVRYAGIDSVLAGEMRNEVLNKPKD